MDNSSVSSGQLLVSVQGAGGSYPLPGASVTVKVRTKDGLEVLWSGKSDLSGRSAVIEIPTPARSASLTPSGGRKPYAQVVIRAQLDGYYPAEYVDVPVFPGVESIQNVYLVPRPVYAPDVSFDDAVYFERQGADL